MIRNAVLSALLWIVACAETKADAFHAQHKLIINGAASQLEFKKPIYDAMLNLSFAETNRQGVYQQNEFKQMKIVVQKPRWRKNQFSQHWLSGISINSGLEQLEKHQEDILKLAAATKKTLVKGDIITFNYIPDEATEFLINDVKITSLSPELFNLLVSTWIGPRANSEFRESILQLGPNNADLIIQMTEAKPSEEATARVAQWSKPRPILVVATPVSQPAGPTAEEIALQARLKAKESAAAELEKQRLAEAVEAQRIKQLQQAEALRIAEEKAVLEQIEAEKQARIAYSKAVYSSKVIAHTTGYVKYPRKALSREQEGQVRLQLYFNHEGEITDQELVQSSGFSDLDRAALRAIRRAAPYPLPERTLKGEIIVVEVPVNFRLN